MNSIRLHSIEKVEFLRITVIEGERVVGSPMRLVHYYCDPKSGEIKFIHDTMSEVDNTDGVTNMPTDPSAR